MKKILPILILMLIASVSKAQMRPSDSLYVWVRFTDKLIIMEIPDMYVNHRTQLQVKPRHVMINQVPKFVPDLPPKEKILSGLATELNGYDKLLSKEEQLRFLGKIVLLLYFSNNETTYINQHIRNNLNSLINKSQVEIEASHVKKWITMIETMNNS